MGLRLINSRFWTEFLSDPRKWLLEFLIACTFASALLNPRAHPSHRIECVSTHGGHSHSILRRAPSAIAPRGSPMLCILCWKCAR